MPPRRRRAAPGGAAAPAAAAPTAFVTIEDLPDSLLSSIFSLAGPLKAVGPAACATSRRFRQALLSDAERWSSFVLGPPPHRAQRAADRQAWLAAKLGLLRSVAALVESFAIEGAEELEAWAKPCRGCWGAERFLAALDAGALSALRLEGAPGRRAVLERVAGFEGLTELQLSSSSRPLPKGTAALVGGLPGLRMLSLYSWGGAGSRPQLTPLPPGVVSEALPRLSQLTYLQLGAAGVLAASQLTCLAGSLRMLSLFDQGLPAGGVPPPPTRAQFPLLTSYAADWEVNCQVAGSRVGSISCTLAYGDAAACTGRAVQATADVALQRLYLSSHGGTLQDLLSMVMPPWAALQQLAVSGSVHADQELRCAMLSELRALSFQCWSASALPLLLEQAPHLTSLSFDTGHMSYVSHRLREVPPSLACLPLRRLKLCGVDLEDLPVGRYLEELDELELRVVRRLPAALAGTRVRRLALAVGRVGPPAPTPLVTTQDVDNSLLLMPRLRDLELRLAVVPREVVAPEVVEHLRTLAPHVNITYT